MSEINNLISVTKFEVTSADTDMQARIRLGMLVNLLIQSAIKSADSLGFGFENLQKQNLFWVLSRLTVEIKRPLEWYEKVEVETWPKDIEKILYLRDFFIRDKNGKDIANGTSGWLAIDIDTKRPGRVDDLSQELLIKLKNKHALEEHPLKLNQLTEGDSFEVDTTYYDIDLNRHVTSTRYVDWMMDTFPVEFHKLNYPKGLSINYLKETMPGEKVRLIRSKAGAESYNFEGINTSTGKSAFRGKIDF